jgi:hypothetical protein
MWGKFWFGVDRQARDTELWNLEVGDAGSASPTPERVWRAGETPPAGDQAGEIAEFLTRVYTHQQC